MDENGKLDDFVAQEPDDLGAIRKLRPTGHGFRGDAPSGAGYRDRLAGAFLGRCAGCILGAPVEAWEISRMESWAREIGDAFPPRDYWTAVPNPDVLRYRTTRSDAYTRRRLDGIPVDDDLQYTLLGLFLLEQAGPKFSVDDVAEAWRLYLPFACTAEEVALANLRRGVAPTVAGNTGGIAPPAQHCYFSEVDPGPGAAPLANPYREWIGAAIRADPWGYVAPGRPECAAAMAFHDAFLSHRRNGIYAEMLFAATIAAAFVVDDPVRAVRIGLAEIPERSRLASAVRWALEEAPGIRDYRDAHDAAVDRFPGMSPVHAINNACLTVWGLSIGGTDLDRVLGETVAMGFDNDCTAATAGSIVGAIIGRSGISSRWIDPFGDTIHSYLNGISSLSVHDVLARFERQKDRVLGQFPLQQYNP